jgi:hypothetical protein
LTSSFIASAAPPAGSPARQAVRQVFVILHGFQDGR